MRHGIDRQYYSSFSNRTRFTGLRFELHRKLRRADMKAMDVIDRLDGLEPNQYSPEQKLRWLSILDGKIYEEVLRPRETEPRGFAEYVNGNEELLVPFPYGDDVYLNYLQAMVALENAETQRYNKRLQFFNNAYAEYQNWYNRRHSLSDVTDGGARRCFIF